MALVRPFRGVHYNPLKRLKIEDLITPPYDVIPPGDDEKYRSRSLYNFAHLDLAHSATDDYTQAATTLAKWREVGVLQEDSSDSYYLYRQVFSIDGKTHRRDTLMATVGLCDFSKAIVRPHENTHGKYKADRLQHLRKTRCNLSHIFGMVKDPEGFLAGLFERFQFQSPLFRGTTEDGVEHTLWTAEASKAPEVTAFFETKPVYIVDGHHRYESSLAYARELGVEGKWDHPAAHMMFAISNAFDPGLVVLPTHRVVSGMETARVTLKSVQDRFDLSPMTEEGLELFVQSTKPTPQFGLWLLGKLYACQPRDWQKARVELGSLARLSVHWSDDVLLGKLFGIEDASRREKIQYERHHQDAWRQREKAQAVIFHAPPAITDVTDVADERRFMPQKSTFFYPKLAAGLVIRPVA